MSGKPDLINKFYSSIYLTFISLLQGIALGLLLPEFINYLRTSEHPFNEISILPFIITLIIVFTIWHHYTFQVFYLRWFPNILDALLPFLIATVEFFLISFVSSKTPEYEVDLKGWTISFIVFLFLGSFAYFGVLRNDIRLFSNIMNQENAIQLDSYCKKLGIILGCSLLFQGFFAIMIVLINAEPLLWISLIFYLIVPLIFTEYYVSYKLKPLFVKATEEYTRD